MDSGGGGTTTVTQQPPQLLPQGEGGYNKAQTYYQTILGNPPIYEGPRVAPINATQKAYLQQARAGLGKKQTYQKSAEKQAFRTTEGDYLYDPNAGREWNPNAMPSYIGNEGDRYSDYFSPRENLSDTGLIEQGLLKGFSSSGAASGASAKYNPSAGWIKPKDEDIQRYVQSASQPYLRQLEETTLPGIQSDFGIGGGGVNNTREQISKQDAMNRTSSTIATDVIAPIFNEMERLDEAFKNNERDREAAIASGDADRATQASIASAQIQKDMRGLEAQLRIAGSELKTQGRQAGAKNILEMTEGERARRLATLEGGQERGLRANISQNQLRESAWESERNRMLAAAGLTPQLMQSEIMRQMFLRQAGDYERAFNQEAIDAQRAAWAEPIQMQSNAASALFGASGMGPGSASSMVEQNSNPMNDIVSLISSAALIYGMFTGL